MNYGAKRREATAKRVERRHACPSCDARFPFPNKLRLHINSNHSLANACELCSERFNRFNELRTHMRRAHQIIHQCHLCAYSSSVRAELRKHFVKCHENGVRCTIDGCDATVAYNRLRRHIKETHCSSLQGDMTVDDQILEGPSEPENNLPENLTEVRFSSAAAGSTITSAFSQIEFVNIHDNLPQMDKMQKLTSNHFSPRIPPQNAEMSIHLCSMVQHDGAIAEGDCSDYCGGTEKAAEMEESNSENINQEESLNASAVPGRYECQKCGKIFHDVYKSRRHWNRVHLKKYEEKIRLKKYTCKILECARRFPCLSKLQDHMLTVHSEYAAFDCGTCNKKFSSRASFAIHLRRYHLVSIRNVPYGFTDGNDVSPVSISD